MQEVAENVNRVMHAGYVKAVGERAWRACHDRGVGGAKKSHKQSCLHLVSFERIQGLGCICLMIAMFAPAKTWFSAQGFFSWQVLRDEDGNVEYELSAEDEWAVEEFLGWAV